MDVNPIEGKKFYNNRYLRIFLLLIIYVLYLIFGATIFSNVEGYYEAKLIEKTKGIREKFFLNHQKCLTNEELEKFIEAIIIANNRGVSAQRNVTGTPNWSFGQSIFFSGTVLTTIGYGRVTPLSEGGKVFCILYALFGIPLTLVVFGAIIERLMVFSNFCFTNFEFRMKFIKSIFKLRMVYVSMIIGLIFIFIFLLPALIFASLEETWSYLDAFYYCFISMTTIGLGDYIPGDSYTTNGFRPIYKMIITVYLFVGLICMFFLLQVINTIPELNFSYYFSYHIKEDNDLKVADSVTDSDDTEKSRLCEKNANNSNYTRQFDENGS